MQTAGLVLRRSCRREQIPRARRLCFEASVRQGWRGVVAKRKQAATSRHLKHFERRRGCCLTRRRCRRPLPRAPCRAHASRACQRRLCGHAFGRGRKQSESRYVDGRTVGQQHLPRGRTWLVCAGRGAAARPRRARGSVVASRPRRAWFSTDGSVSMRASFAC